MTDLSGKTAFVTGAGQGLGEGIALVLAEAGANVVVADLNQENAQKVSARIQDIGQKSDAFYIDVTDGESIDAAVQQAYQHFGHIDILVNNAGVMQRYPGLETTTGDFDFCLDVNVKGLWQVTQAFMPHFQERQFGRIINIASIGGRRGWAETPAYGASKAAVINITQSLALSLAPFGVTVNAVCPGLVATDMAKEVGKLFSAPGEEGSHKEKALERIPLKRQSTPEDIGWAVAFFASDKAGNITAQALNVDGGLIMN